MLLGFAFGGVVTAVFSSILVFHFREYDFEDAISFLVGNVIIYGAGGYLLFHFVNVGEASIRFRILRELNREEEPIFETELRSRYNDDLILRARLERLVGNGMIRHSEGNYVLASGTVLEPVARTMMWIKRFLIRRESEFEAMKSDK